MVGFENLHSEVLSGTVARLQSNKGVPEIASTVLAVILRYLQVKDHHLVATACMLDGAFVRRFYSNRRTLTVSATGLPFRWPCPDINASFAFYPCHF